MADTAKTLAQCADCGAVFPASQLRDIRRYWERVDEDDVTKPDGECPHCGALAYIDSTLEQESLPKCVR